MPWQIWVSVRGVEVQPRLLCDGVGVFEGAVLVVELTRHHVVANLDPQKTRGGVVFPVGGAAPAHQIRFLRCRTGHDEVGSAGRLKPLAVVVMSTEVDIGHPADVVVEEVEARDFSIGTAKIKTALINHRAGITCLGFRIEANGRSIAYLPDVEYLHEEHRQQIIDLIAGVDLLFHDAMLTSEEYPKHRGRGHCSIDDGVDIAVRAKVGRLVLFSHHPDRSDAEIDTILVACLGNGVAVDAGREGTEYAL